MAKKAYTSNGSGGLTEIDPLTRQPLNGGTITSPQQKKAADDLGEAFGINSPRQFDASQRNAIAQTKAAFEPSVISSDNIDKLNQDNKNKLATMSQKGTTVGADGSVYDATGSMVPAPAGAIYNDKTGTYDAGGQQYGVADFYEDDPDGDWKAIQNLFAPLRASLDSSTLASVNAIHQQYESLRANQKAYNDAAEKGRSRALQLGGSSRYAPLSAGSNTLSQVSYGLRQIADLDAKENMATAQAKQAQEDGNFRLLNQALGMAETVRKEKQAAAQKVMSDLQEASQKTQEAHQAAMRDEAIADVMASGITKNADILKALNAQGGDYTAEEVAKAIKNLAPTGTAGLYKFSNDDVGKMLASGMNANQIQATQDYYNGTGAAPQLSGGQQQAVTKALGGVVAGDGAGFKFTSTQKSQLLSRNFTSSEINAMQSDVATHGIDAVVEGMPAEQQQFVKRVLAGSDTVAENGIGDETKLTRAKLAQIYGIDDNDEGGGWFGGDTNAESLDALEALVDRYKEFYTDKEILKMIEGQQEE